MFCSGSERGSSNSMVVQTQFRFYVHTIPGDALVVGGGGGGLGLYFCREENISVCASPLLELLDGACITSPGIHVTFSR
jgi:hypothetical protein